MTAAIKSSLVALVIGLIVGWLVNGWRLGKTIAEMNATHAKELTDAAEAARERERALAEESAALHEQLRKDSANAKKQIDRLNADLASGRLRLSVSVRGTGASAPAESGQARAELDAETSQSLVAIAAEGDTVIRELNTCIDAYDALRSGL